MTEIPHARGASKIVVSLNGSNNDDASFHMGFEAARPAPPPEDVVRVPPFALSTASNERLEAVAKVGGELWFQLYVVHRQLAATLVDRAANAGYAALVLTVDVPVNGKRERDPQRVSDPIPLFGPHDPRHSHSSAMDGQSSHEWHANARKFGRS